MTAMNHDHAYSRQRPASVVQMDRGMLSHRVIFAWWHMRRATARLQAAGPTEVYLFQLLILSSLGSALAWLIRAVIVPAPGGLTIIEIPLAGFAGVILGRIVALYLLAMLLGAACRRLGGIGDDPATRLAVFWAALVAMPIDVAAALVVVVLHLLGGWFAVLESPQVMNGFYWIGLLAFVWYLSAAIAQVHQFRSTARVFLYIALGCLVALLLALYLWARGVI